MPALPSDLEIARAARLKPVTDIARSLGIENDELELYGRYKAKISLDVLQRLKDSPDGKLIAVTAIPPRRSEKVKASQPSDWAKRSRR